MSIVQYPINSFIRANVIPVANCAEQISQCLPVYDVNDIAFMFTNNQGPIFTSIYEYTLSLIKNGVVIGTPKIMPRAQMSITDIIDYVYINDISSMGFETEIDDGECFFLRISANVTSPVPGDFEPYTLILFQSSCFQKISDPCWTSLIKYRCNENSFGFYYFLDNGAGNQVASFYNKIRLPFYLKEPQFPTTRNVFIKSDGTRKKLSARIATEYEALTDYMPKDWHEKLVVALEHDEVLITNTNSVLTLQAVSQEGDYQIDWQHFLDYPTAPAKFKLFKTPYNNVNSNCK